MSNRLAKVKIHYEVLADLLQARSNFSRSVWSDAPPDLEIVDIGADWKDRVSRVFWAIVRSESFAPVIEGALMPEVVFTFSDARKEAGDAQRV